MGKYDEFARWLRIKLAEKGWKGADLVREAELKGQYFATSTVSKWTKGSVQPSRENCALLAEILNVSVAEIMALAGHERIEDAGPLSDLSRRLAQLPDATRAYAIQRIQEYSNSLIAVLQHSGTTHIPDSALHDANAAYLTDSQRLLDLLPQLDTDVLAQLLADAESAIAQQTR